jgi:hypothetical protein
MVAAGVSDNAAPVLLGRKRSDLVVCASQLERADGLKVLRLKVKVAAVLRAARFVKMRRNQLCSYGNATKARLGFTNIVESDDGTVSAVYDLSS